MTCQIHGCYFLELREISDLFAMLFFHFSKIIQIENLLKSFIFPVIVHGHVFDKNLSSAD